MLIRRVARPMLAASFVSQGAEALSSPMAAAEAAQPAVDGLQRMPRPVSDRAPADPETLARITAATQIAGGLLLASGRLPRLAAAALAATVVPANLGAHMFWSESDPARRSRKRRDFMVDVSLLGGLIIASADTAGRPSVAWLGRRAARTVAAGVSDVAGAAAHRGTALGTEAAQTVRSSARRLAHR